MADIDYSGIKESPATQANTWRPPRHAYFGPKGPDGEMIEEPLLNQGKGPYIPFPKHVYNKRADGSVQVRVVNNDEEWVALGKKDWVTPDKIGVVTAPSFEQSLQMKG